jgi:hypothetical protein
MDMTKAKALMSQMLALPSEQLQLLQHAADNNTFTGPLVGFATVAVELKGVLDFFSAMSTIKIPA